MQASDTAWMMRALELAGRGEGLTRPNPPVGAVVVKDGRVVGEGYHRVAGGPHAEVVALDRAGLRARGSTLYVTLEPCCTHGRTPPCVDRILRERVRRVVVAATDPNPRHRGRGIALLRRGGVRVETGLCRAEAESILAPFRTWILEHRPHVTLKMAMSLDGRITDGAGRSKWVTGPQARQDVQRLRKKCDAVLVGVDTVIADDPSLLCRLRRTQNLVRVVVDSRGRTPLNARVLNDAEAGRTLIATTRLCSVRRRQQFEGKGARVAVLPTKSGRVSLRALLSRLGQEGLMQVLCEGGGTLAGALLDQRLVDEGVLYVAPTFLGAQGRAVVNGVNGALLRAPRVSFRAVTRVGHDLRVCTGPLRPRRAGEG
jgi:diaminohydroxyphosphoribosylaminopyrimidine deaminase/5-amino-6-(5-phosphoribosylamino)uracil reductase